MTTHATESLERWVALRMTPSLYEHLTHLSDARQTSVSQVIRDALTAHLYREGRLR